MLIKFLNGNFCTKLHISFIRFRFANSIIRSTGLFWVCRRSLCIGCKLQNYGNKCGKVRLDGRVDKQCCFDKNYQNNLLIRFPRIWVCEVYNLLGFSAINYQSHDNVWIFIEKFYWKIFYTKEKEKPFVIQRTSKYPVNLKVLSECLRVTLECLESILKHLKVSLSTFKYLRVP